MSVCPSPVQVSDSSSSCGRARCLSLDSVSQGVGDRVGDGVKRSAFVHVHALLLLMTLLVAGSFPVAESMMDSIALADLNVGGSDLMLLRFVLAALLFAPYVLIAFGWRLPSLVQLRIYAVLALPLVIFFSCMFASLTMTSALNTGALFTTVPTFTALLAWKLNGEKNSGRRVCGLLLGTFGALWVVFRGDLGVFLRFGFNSGDALFLLGCVFLSVYQPLVKRWSLRVPVAVMTFWVIVMAAFWLLIALGVKSWFNPAVVNSISISALAELPYSVYWGLLYLSVFTTLLSFFVQQLGSLTIGPSRTSSYSLLTPSMVMIISVLIEPALFAWVLVPGAVLVILGLLLLQTEQAP